MDNETLQNHLRELAEKQQPFKEKTQEKEKPDMTLDSNGERVPRFKRILKQLPKDK